MSPLIHSFFTILIFLFTLPYYLILSYLLQSFLPFPRLLRISTPLLSSPLTSPLTSPLAIWGPEYMIEPVLHPLPQELQLRLHGSVGHPHLPHEPGLLFQSRPDSLQERTNVRSSLTPYVPWSSPPCPPARPLLQALLLPHLLLRNRPRASDLALSPGLLAAQAGLNVGHLL